MDAKDAWQGFAKWARLLDQNSRFYGPAKFGKFSQNVGNDYMYFKTNVRTKLYYILEYALLKNIF
jgi:hypothetical protein